MQVGKMVMLQREDSAPARITQSICRLIILIIVKDLQIHPIDSAPNLICLDGRYIMWHLFHIDVYRMLDSWTTYLGVCYLGRVKMVQIIFD